jgi:crotonobetainyl-CoA:carnitine CoA-transferase CaiB-like acyl-CoA transferase
MFSAQPAAHWLERLRTADILCGPINEFADIAADGAFGEELPLVDSMALNVPQAVALPIRFNGRFAETIRRAPAKGEHTKQILAEFGFSSDEVERFFDEGVVFSSRNTD